MLDINKILKALNGHKVKYVVIGGVAAIAQGSVHLTLDLDICYGRDEENLKNLAGALTDFHPTLRGAPKDLSFLFDAKTLQAGLNFALSTDVGDIDLIGEMTGLGDYAEVFKYSEKLKIYDLECYVLTLEGLIKNKRAIGREKDLRALIELEALLEIKRRENEKI